MSAKLSRSLKKMSREDLVLLIRDLTLENERLKAEQEGAGDETPREEIEDVYLAEEMRSLRASVDALRRSLDSWGGRMLRAPGEGDTR